MPVPPRTPVHLAAPEGEPGVESIPDLIAEWPEVGMFFDGDETPWRATVASWPPPWRRMWGALAQAHEEAGVPPGEAERLAFAEVEEGRRNPRRTAGVLPGGEKVVKDAVARPRMVGKTVTKKDRRIARETGGGLFDALNDGNENSSTYRRE